MLEYKIKWLNLFINPTKSTYFKKKKIATKSTPYNWANVTMLINYWINLYLKK